VHKEPLFDLALLAIVVYNILVVPCSKYNVNSFRALHFLIELVFDIFISQFIIDEVSAGEQKQAKKRLEIIANCAQLEITDDVTTLAQALLSDGIIPKKAATDAAHIAVAAVHGMDYLMTWNCTHIANATIFNSVKRVCIEQGFSFPIICTPEELLGE
jgi:predicted nucleic acid-binding protein